MSGQASKSSTSMHCITEEEEEEQIENQAGGILDQAESYIRDFTMSRIDLVPTIRGGLLA